MWIIALASLQGRLSEQQRDIIDALGNDDQLRFAECCLCLFTEGKYHHAILYGDVTLIWLDSNLSSKNTNC